MFTINLQELKNKQTEISNTLEGINSRINKTEGWINEVEDKMVEINAAEQNIGKIKWILPKRPWDNIKFTNIHIIGVLEEYKREVIW